MAANLIERVLRTIRNHFMFESGDTVLAAVSGGPDSIFLLHALLRLKGKLRLKELAVCNLDHGLRKGESELDSAFVSREAQRLGLRCIHKRIELAKAQGRKISTEEAARQARYAFFREAAASVGADAVATGHTIDDQAETVLMRVIMGSSLKGIVGIAPRREEGGLRIVRPIVELTKEEISAYLKSSGIEYRIDSSNLEDRYFRNVVRRDVIPFLERYNPRLKRSIFNLAQHLREDFEYIDKERSRSSARLAGAVDGRVEIALKDIVLQPRAIQKELLRDSLGNVGGDIKKLSYRHWDEVSSLLRTKGSGRSVDLPGSVRVTRTGRSLVFSKILP
jgi:tRNA(Ile)-lysidine synthase